MSEQVVNGAALLPALERFEGLHAEFPGAEIGRLLDLGREILAQSTDGSGAAATDSADWLWRWLELFRREPLLRELQRQERGEEWFAIVIDALYRLNLTTGELFRRRVKQYGDEALFLTFEGEEIRQHSWSAIGRRVDDVARGLLDLGAADMPVALFAANCVDTAVCDLACLTRGIVDAVIPASATPDHISQILAETRARIVIVRDAENFALIHSAAQGGQRLERIIVMDARACAKDPRMLPLDELEARGRISRQNSEVWPEPRLDDLATVMFTSGTTGRPKGICFTHLNIVSKRFARGLALPFVGEENVFVAYLPLSHTFGRWLELLATIYWGGRYAFAQNPSIGTVLDNMRRARATGFISVPQKWLQLREEIGKVVDVDAAPQAEVQRALERLTGGRLRWGLSAAGYLDEDVFLFMQRHGLELMSGFGMTEATGGITMTPPGAYVEGTIGRALPGIELKVADDGELLIRGPYVTAGYFGETSFPQPARSDWLPTGDVISIDESGYFRMLDRKKDIYKNLKGETIAPQRIENLFNEFPGVGRVFLVGDHRPYNALLIAADPANDDLRGLGEAERKEFFRPYVVAANRFLAPHERVVDFAVLPDGFSESELTSKGTYKRRVVEERRAALIEPLYRRDYMELPIGGLVVRLPHWFLRAKGLTEAGVTVEGDALLLAEAGARLHVARCTDDPRCVRIGSLDYQLDGSKINLDLWLRNASLWVGNADFVAFSGPEIAKWRSTAAPANIRLRFDRRCTPRHAVRELSAADLAGPVGAFLTLHRAGAIIAAPSAREPALAAVAHLGAVLQEGTYEYVALARERLAWAAYHDEFDVRAAAYQALLRGEIEREREELIKTFVFSGRDYLNDDVIESICASGLDDEQLSAMRLRLEWYRSELPWPQPPAVTRLFLQSIDLLTNYAQHHRPSYAAVSGELASWQLFEGSEEMRRRAEEAMEALCADMRHYLMPLFRRGAEQAPTWDEIIEFELGIDDQDRRRIRKLLAETTILPETIYVLYGAKVIEMGDLPPGGVWVALRGLRFGRSLFHVTVETRSQERYEFVLAMNLRQTHEQIRTTGLLRMRCAHMPERPPDIARFGGMWLDEWITTREHISGESLSSLWQRIATSGRDELTDTALWECKHHLRLAVAALFGFWHQTRRRWMLQDPSPRDLVIPSRQVLRMIRLVTISGRMPFTNLTDLVLSIYRGLYTPLHHQCPALRPLLDAVIIYEAFLEIVGERRGRARFAEVLDELPRRADVDARTRDAFARIADEDIRVAHEGFRPFPLRAAAHRYRQWLALNPHATTEAKVETVTGNYRWHNLQALEREYPDVRLRLFRETVWATAPQPLAAVLDAAIQELRGGGNAQQQIQRKVSEIRSELQLSADDDRYLTWLTYPHLRPGETARLVRGGAAHRAAFELDTVIHDNRGGRYDVRHATSTRELARLSRIFRHTSLSVLSHPESEALLALDDRGNVASGLLYVPLGDEHTWIQALAVAPGARGRGLGRSLFEEFERRARADGVRVLTVDFALPAFWIHLGFHAHAAYGGLTKTLR